MQVEIAMSKKLGKKLPGARYPSGELKRPTVQQRRNRERERNMQEVVTVMRQPHRRAAKDPYHKWLECALGRFCLAHGLHEAIYNAGTEYSELMRQWRAARGVPTSVREGVGGSGQGPSADTVAKWWQEINRIERSLMRLDNRNAHFFAARRLCVDDIDLMADLSPVAVAALLALANVMKKNLGKHPFAKGAH
jgi:hypothetical protein